MSTHMERPRRGPGAQSPGVGDAADDVILPPTSDDPAEAAQLDLIASLEEGRRRRDRGQQTAEHATDVQWKLAFNETVRRWARTGQVFTVYEVLAEVGDPPAGSSKVFGTLMSAAARRGEIAKTGTVRQSPKASRAGGWVFEWRGVA